MADPPHRCESRRVALRIKLKAGVRRVLDHVPTDCPLCLGVSRGSRPCEGCLDDIWSRSPPHRCPVCALGLPRGLACPDCAALGPAFERVVAAFDYGPPADQLILQLKNSGRFQHARFMADLLAGSLQAQAPELADRITIVLPVPSSRQALRRRGFNPAGEIARQVAARLNLPYRPGLIRRGREGISQKTLGRAARTQGQADRYICLGRMDGAMAAVVDDVLTTGTTLHAVAEALKRSGAATVVGLVVARTPYRQEN